MTLSLKSVYQGYIKNFLALYAFLSGFVFFEPSLAEYAFLLAFPGLLLAWRFSRRALILALLLFVPALLSAAYGYLKFGNLNVRFLAIDLYLFSLFIVGQGAFRVDEGERKRLMARIAGAMALASIIGLLFGLFIYLRLIDMPGMRIVYVNRLYGFFKDTNVFASYMLIPFFYYAQRFFDTPSLRKALPAAALCIAMSVGILLSFSRAAWLAYGVGLLILIVRAAFSSNKSIRFKALAFILLFGLAIAALLSGTLKIGEFDIGSIIQSRLGLLGYDAKRFNAQAKAFDMLQDSPVFGVGPGNYEKYSKLSAHSLYHRILGERGFVGTLSLISFAIMIILSLRKKRLEAFLLALILGLLLESFFIDTLHWRHFWLILILILGKSDLSGK